MQTDFSLADKNLFRSPKFIFMPAKLAFLSGSMQESLSKILITVQLSIDFVKTNCISDQEVGTIISPYLYRRVEFDFCLIRTFTQVDFEVRQLNRFRLLFKLPRMENDKNNGNCILVLFLHWFIHCFTGHVLQLGCSEPFLITQEKFIVSNAGKPVLYLKHLFCIW